MFTGRQFELKTPTMAIESVAGKREVVTIPAGAKVKVVSGPRDGDRMIDVLWNGREVVIFLVDLESRGKAVGA